MTERHEPGTSDEQLLAKLKQSAMKYRYTPGALLLAGETMAEFQQVALISILGPHPTVTDEVTVDQDSLAKWPDWVAELVPPGSKWERLHWPDGSATIRLLDPCGQVLAARRMASTQKADK